MSKFVVTQDQYQAVSGTNPSKLKGKDKPVNGVDWDDAQAFCKRLSEQVKLTVRLPTEAEWEFSCRAGTKTEYYFGDAETDLDGVGWYAGNSKGTLHPVGQKAPNAFGLYDMHGNVGQWCVDRYADDSYSKSMVEDPQGPQTGKLRATRGGTWGTPAWMCKSGVTFGAEVDDRSVGLGIRIVLPVPTAP
jgi:formylglycine-generating enzyme required for sulfatase activity